MPKNMLTPYKLKTLSIWLKPKKILLWFALIIGLVIFITPFVLINVFDIKTFPNIPIAIGFLVIMFSWGMICIESWFSDKEPGTISNKLINMFPKLHRVGKSVFDWYGSIFINLWFLVGVGAALLLLIQK